MIAGVAFSRRADNKADCKSERGAVKGQQSSVAAMDSDT